MLYHAPDGAAIWRMVDLEPALVTSALSQMRRDALPRWTVAAYAEFNAEVLDEAFPCTFGTVAQRRGDVRYAFLEPSDAEDAGRLTREALIAFTDLVRPLEPVAASLVPLAVFMPPSPETMTVDEYFVRGWTLLRWLHAHDPMPWPAHEVADVFVVFDRVTRSKNWGSPSSVR